MDRRDNVAGPRPSEDAASSTERMRSRLTRTVRGPLSSVTERTEAPSDEAPKTSPPVAPKRASLRERITRRPSISKLAPPAFGAGNLPAAPQVAPTPVSRPQVLPPRPRTSPPVPNRERKPDIGPRGRSMARLHPDDVFLNGPESESEYSSNLSANTQATSIFESDATPTPVEKERRMVRRPAAAAEKRGAAVRTGRAARSVGAQPRRMIHIQVQPQQSQKSTSEPEDDSAATQFQEEISRLRQEVRELKQGQSSSDRGLEHALDRLSLVALEREEDKRSMHLEKHTHESLKREVELRCKTIVGLKARLEDREETLDCLTTRFDARARDLDGLKTQVEARERSLDEVKAILASREKTIEELQVERKAAIKEKEDSLKDSLKANASLLEEINGLEKERKEVLGKKKEAEEERDGLAKEKELWVMEREKFGLEVDHLRDDKLELEAKVGELTKEVDTHLAVRGDQETLLIERVAALEIIQESLDGQVDSLTTKIVTGQTEIEGLKKALEVEQAALKETTGSLEEARGKLEVARTELEEVKGVAKTELEEVKGGLEKEKDGLAQEKTTLETRVAEVEGETAELKTKLQGLEGEKKAGEEEITALATERDDLKMKSTDLELQLEKLQQDETITRADLDIVRESEGKLRTDLQMQRENGAAAVTVLEKLREENTALQGEIAAAREAATTAAEETAAAREAAATAAEETAAAREAATTAAEAAAPAPADTAEADSLRTENVELKQKNEELEARVTKVAGDLEEQSSKLEEQSKRLEEEAKKVEEGFKRLEDESATRAATAPEAAGGGDDGKAEELARRVELLEGEKAALAAQLETATAKVSELNATHQGELVALRVQIRGLARMSSTRSKSPKKRVKGDELVIVRNPQDRSQLQVMRKSEFKALGSSISTQSSDNDD